MKASIVPQTGAARPPDNGWPWAANAAKRCEINWKIIGGMMVYDKYLNFARK